jgi:hypothetical protein
VKFNLNGFPNNAADIFGFCGEDGSIAELDAVCLFDTVLSYGRLVRMF